MTKQLYNFVAQSDNSLNAKIATQTGLDGAAMKTLAFVTMLFLPPTFVAVRLLISADYMRKYLLCQSKSEKLMHNVCQRLFSVCRCSIGRPHHRQHQVLPPPPMWCRSFGSTGLSPCHWLRWCLADGDCGGIASRATIFACIPRSANRSRI